MIFMNVALFETSIDQKTISHETTSLLKIFNGCTEMEVNLSSQCHTSTAPSSNLMAPLFSPPSPSSEGGGGSGEGGRGGWWEGVCVGRIPRWLPLSPSRRPVPRELCNHT